MYQTTLHILVLWCWCQTILQINLKNTIFLLIRNKICLCYSWVHILCKSLGILTIGETSQPWISNALQRNWHHTEICNNKVKLEKLENTEIQGKLKRTLHRECWGRRGISWGFHVTKHFAISSLYLVINDFWLDFSRPYLYNKTHRLLL